MVGGGEMGKGKAQRAAFQQAPRAPAQPSTPSAPSAHRGGEELLQNQVAAGGQRKAVCAVKGGLPLAHAQPRLAGLIGVQAPQACGGGGRRGGAGRVLAVSRRGKAAVETALIRTTQLPPRGEPATRRTLLRQLRLQVSAEHALIHLLRW